MTRSAYPCAGRCGARAGTSSTCLPGASGSLSIITVISGSTSERGTAGSATPFKTSEVDELTHKIRSNTRVRRGGCDKLGRPQRRAGQRFLFDGTQRTQREPVVVAADKLIAGVRVHAPMDQAVAQILSGYVGAHQRVPRLSVDRSGLRRSFLSFLDLLVYRPPSAISRRPLASLVESRFQK